MTASTKDFEILPELEALLSPLPAEDFEMLTHLCNSDGIRDSLIVAVLPDGQRILADGHNRLRIAEADDLDFEVMDIEFDNINDVMIWMIENQSARRNQTDGQKFANALKKKELLLKQGYEIRSQNLSKSPEVLFTNTSSDNNEDLDFFAPTKHSTREIIANDLGWSQSKVAKADVVFKKNDPEIIEAVKAGTKSINEAYKEIKAVEKTETLQVKKAEVLASLAAEIETPPTIKEAHCIDFLLEFEDNSIDLLFTDPPYSTDIDDIEDFVADWLPFAIQKTKSTGRLFICSGAYPAEMQAYLNILLGQQKFIVDAPLIWTYKNTLGITPKSKYNLNYQVIWHLYSQDSPLLDTSITNEMFSVQEINAPDGRQGNRFHTWQKPDELANRIIRHATKEGDLVVDPFSCTGTFILQAAKLKRIGKGCDNNRDNIEIAVKRGCNELEG